MSHPYKAQAEGSNKSKRSSMSAGASKLPNLYMNGAYKDVKGSTGNIQQHKDQNAAPGMKRGGRLDKSSRSKKSKIKIAPDLVQASPPSPEDMIGAQAGAGSPSPLPAPATPMPMPMRKHGGAVHSDIKEDKGLIKKMVKPSAIKKADGGSISQKRENEDAARQTREILERRGIVTPAKAGGGSVSLGKYPLKKGGAESGVGRLELSKKS